jgi:hypothetical protein
MGKNGHNFARRKKVIGVRGASQFNPDEARIRKTVFGLGATVERPSQNPYSHLRPRLERNSDRTRFAQRKAAVAWRVEV